MIRNRKIRRLPLLAAAVLSGLAAVVPATAGAAPAPTPNAPTDQLALRIVVTGVAPFVLKPGKPIVLRGTIVNDSDEPVTRVHLRTRADTQPIDTRFRLAEALTEAGPLGNVVQDIDLQADVAAHATLNWSATMPPDVLGQGANGLRVFIIGVEGRGRVGDASDRTTFARSRLPMPFVGTGARFKPTRLALLWPLIDTPHRGPSRAYFDDDLGELLRESGRLSRLLRSGATPRATTVSGKGAVTAPQQLGLTWVADPALLQGAADLADGYRVSEGKRTLEGPNAGPAKDWMTAAAATLRTAAADRRLLTVPYADVDIEALRRAGLGTDVGAAVRRGAEQVHDLLGVDPADDLVWPPGEHLTPETLDLLATSKVGAVLLSGSALPLAESLNYTPSGRAELDSAAGTMPTLLSDPTLDSVLAAGVDGPDPASGLAADGEPPAPIALVQRFLAETAVVTTELPSRSRDLIAAPPRRWNPNEQFVNALLARVGDVPWLSLTPLNDLRALSTEPLERSPLVYPPPLRSAELSPGYLLGRDTGVGPLRARLKDLRSVLGDQSATATLPFDLALLRTESSQWRADAADGEALRRLTASALLSDTARVRIASAGLITLASQRGTLPITMENGLDYPVNVRLRLTTPSRARLTASEGQIYTVEAHRKRTLQIDAKAFTSGVFSVDAQLVTPDGQPYGSVVRLRVRSTGYGAIAVAITTGGLVVLAVAIVVRLTRRVIRSRRRAPA